MNLDLDRDAWNRVAFGDVVSNINVTVRDPASAGIDRVIAMEHLDAGELRIRRWGHLAAGTTFTRRVRPGQTLFGKRRAYQRKVALAGFDAICSGDILTFEADPTKMLPTFLPLLVQSDDFYHHALGSSAGSLSPRTNWRALASFEFDLPPLDQQKRIADLMWAAEEHRLALANVITSLVNTEESWLSRVYSDPEVAHISVARLIRSGQITLLTGPFGSALSATEYIEDGVPVIHPSFIVEGRLTVDSHSTVGDETAKRLSRWRVQEGDLIFMRKRDVTRSAVVRASEVGWLLGSDCISLRVNGAGWDPYFIQAMLRSPAAKAELLKRAPGTAMPGINEKSLAALEFPAHDSAAQGRIVARYRRLLRGRADQESTGDALLRLQQDLLVTLLGGTG